MEYESYDLPTCADALAEVRRQFLAGEPLEWRGPENLHSVILATSFPPSWNFSEKGLAYHAEDGRDFWDVYTMVAFQLGYHNGFLRAEKENEVWKTIAQAG